MISYNNIVSKRQIYHQVDYLKLALFLAALISLFAVFQIAQNKLETENQQNGTDEDDSVLRDGFGYNQTLKSLSRSRRSLPFQEDEEIDATRPNSDQLEAYEALVMPELMRTRLYSSNGPNGAESGHLPYLTGDVRAQQRPPPYHLQPAYYSMPNSESNEIYQQQQQAMANLVDDGEPMNVISPAIGDVPRINKQDIDVTNQVPDSFNHLIKHDNLPGDMMAHDYYDLANARDQINLRPAVAQSSNYHPTSKIAEFRIGQNHVVPIHSVDLNAAAGHYYGKKQHNTFVKKKIYYVKAKKKKVIIVKKVKKKKKKHHLHHHGHGKYYMYAKVPKKKSWESGHKRGNKKHWVERHEKGHKNKFKTQVKWYDAKSKGKGHHIWDYNHHDKKKKKHYG